ncbi:metallophosphoesterase family protein [Alteraurantiacibacter aquimixticola]|uniref:Serine/threonine protein phosphatase n=1 Tax=Alteraurantiacibacter aquimixticola TaxID=2489173 RepID=A0A4T3F8C8_9SPHN|nr:metallophosphoesterase family protein [Alteraurantiacibacter aquimixticola]TIX51270.1 serine/threonine protein phosphatase [Alteraurantiacibacter aquimixticola]
MFQFIRSLFREVEEEDLPKVPPGQRVYAVGDIHGRLDLFEALIAAIEADDDEAGSAATTIILLGDLVDRGPDSAGVVRRARLWQMRRDVRILTGNHEEMFLNSFDDLGVMRHFLRHGGSATVASYGVPENSLRSSAVEDVQSLMRRAVPPVERAYISTFEDMIRIGDYIFVHAGIDPETPICSQRKQDLRWIREPFLSHADPLEGVIVHGHTISDDPEDRGNRIGIDTGAYSTGRLTALVLEGARRRYLEAMQDSDGAIAAGPRQMPA